jgi:hypothetical protein
MGQLRQYVANVVLSGPLPVSLTVRLSQGVRGFEVSLHRVRMCSIDSVTWMGNVARLRTSYVLPVFVWFLQGNFDKHSRAFNALIVQRSTLALDHLPQL